MAQTALAGSALAQHVFGNPRATASELLAFEGIGLAPGDVLLGEPALQQLAGPGTPVPEALFRARDGAVVAVEVKRVPLPRAPLEQQRRLVCAAARKLTEQLLGGLAREHALRVGRLAIVLAVPRSSSARARTRLRQRAVAQAATVGALRPVEVHVVGVPDDLF